MVKKEKKEVAPVGKKETKKGGKKAEKKEEKVEQAEWGTYQDKDIKLINLNN